MEFKVLGCSGGIGKGLRTSSYMIDDDILLDAGTGVADLSLDEMVNLRHIFLTHSHLDHVCTIPLLIDTLFDSLNEPLNIYGHPDTINALKKHVFNWTLWPDFSELPNEKTAVMTYHEIMPGDQVKVRDRTITMVEVNHAVTGSAYCVKNTHCSVCFSGDTTTNDTLWQFLNQQKSLSLLVIECGFPNENADIAALAKHYCPDTLVADLDKLQLECEIAITHLKPGGEDRTMEQIKKLRPDQKFSHLKNGDILKL
jgi:ribonuclease BN (tRNA processing enzyme)